MTTEMDFNKVKMEEFRDVYKECVYGVYAIYDKKALETGPVFEAKNHDVAKRSVVSLIMHQDGVAGKDLELWYVGAYDRLTGMLSQVGEIEVIDFFKELEEYSIKSEVKDGKKR